MADGRPYRKLPAFNKDSNDHNPATSGTQWIQIRRLFWHLALLGAVMYLIWKLSLLTEKVTEMEKRLYDQERRFIWEKTR